MKYEKTLKICLPIIIGAMMASSFYAIGENIKLNPIKPVSNKAMTDEQQGILAVRQAKASVVSITGNQLPASGDDPLTISTVAGTGFIWSKDGFIVTNNHVVANASSTYYVMFADGTSYPAKIIGQDKFNDVALLKIDVNNLPAAALGDSGALETGQSVFAIGNSLGKYQNTVTRGVVSGIGRAVTVVNDGGTQQPRLQNLIQTDASINPGNSGGPLIDLAGNVIGMNTLMETDAQGIGFAIPINTIKSSVNELKSTGKVAHAFFGITYATLTAAIQQVKKLPVAQGGLLISVVPGSPADLAGLKPDDIVTQINHQDVNQANELDMAVAKFVPGNQVLVSFLRSGIKMDVLVILGEYK